MEGELILNVKNCEDDNSEDDNSEILFEVIDTGIGINDDGLNKLRRLFDKIEFVDCTINSNTAGIAFGLTISHLLALLLGKFGLHVYS